MLNVLPKPVLWLLSIIAVALAAALPLFSSNYTIRVGALILVFAVVATGLNLILGFAGLLSFGHAAVFGVGAYIAARAMLDTGMELWLIMILATAGAGVFGLLMGLTSWRTGGDYLALVTLGVGQIFFLYTTNARDVTGGATGLPGIPPGVFFGWDLRPLENSYWFFLIITGLVTLFAWVLGHSYFGRAMLAVREDEIIARAHGINVPLTKVLVFGIGGAIAGLGGVLQVLLLGFVGPATFKVDTSIIILEIVLVGGMAATIGPLLGSILIIGATEYLRALADFRMMFFGAIILIVLLWRPGGLAQIFGLSSRTPYMIKIPFLHDLLHKKKDEREAAVKEETKQEVNR